MNCFPAMQCQDGFIYLCQPEILLTVFLPDGKAPTRIMELCEMPQESLCMQQVQLCFEALQSYAGYF